jgi:beta-lactamase class A
MRSIDARLTLLALLLVALVVSTSGCAPDAEEASATTTSRLAEGDALVDVDRLNLRAGPSTNDTVITVMRRGDRVHVKGESVNGFAPVTYGEAEGWAWAEYLKPASAPSAITSLADAVASLAREADARSPGTEIGIAVKNLTTGEYAGAGDDVRHVSASSAKVVWVAAAMYAGADVSDIAGPIFRNSDNYASGTAIDRAGGIDAVNDFYWNVAGMEHSITANWSFGKRRVAQNQGQLGGDNYFTPRDVITFMSKLDGGELLQGRTDELRTYMTWSPRTGYGGWIGTLLPGEARASVMHKAGWLPPPDYAEYSTLNEVGIVQIPGGDRYAIALLAHHGRDYGLEASFVERASCVVYRTIAKDASLSCRD